MKKIIFLTVFACLLTMLVSCDPEPIPPGPPPVTYTISTVISGKGLVNPDKLSMINLGSNVTLKFTPETGHSLYSVKINGVAIEEIQPTETEVSYVIKNINKNIFIEVVFVETSNLIISTVINKNPWKLKEMNIYKEDGTFLFSINLPQEILDGNYYFYYPEGCIKIIMPDNSVFFETTWYIKQEILTMGPPNKFTIVLLTASKFIYRAAPVPGDDEFRTYAEYVLERK